MKSPKVMSGRRVWELPDVTTVPLDKLLVTVLRQRGLDPKAVLAPTYEDLGRSELLPDIAPAVQHLSSLIGTPHEVVVYGDYDIDGLTATTLLVTVLEQLNIRVRPYVPDRFEEGYGLNVEALEQLAADGVHTVVSVDCGSTAVGPINRAVELGLKLIITDHHLLGSDEPQGLIAHINPQRQSNRYPQTSIAGVAVAWHLMRALQRAHLDVLPEGQEKWWLDLVALGTVCDVVPLQDDNRILTWFGLQVLRKTRRPGLLALARVSGVDLDRLQAADLGFRFGPRLNAAGRLEHARLSLDVLLARDEAAALASAEKLNQLNTQRQGLVAEILEQARGQAVAQADKAFLVVSDPGWSHGVAGLIAARLAEEFMKPTAVLQIEGDIAKGSVRTFGGIHVLEILRTADALLTKYGGHGAAAGLTLPAKSIPQLQSQLEAALNDLPESVWIATRWADAWLQSDFVSSAGLAAVAQFEPSGRGHEPIVFVAEGRVVSLRWVGSDKSHAQIEIRTDNADQAVFRLVAFSAARLWPWLEIGKSIRSYVTLSGNVWRGVERAELHVVDLELLSE